MSCIIFGLPRELCYQIIHQLSQEDLFHLSSTCKSCRGELAPKLFKTIKFRNDDKSASSALTAAKKYGYLTQCLEFLHRAAPEKNEDGVPAPFTGPVLLPATRSLLQGSEFPNLKAVTFNFGFQIRNGVEPLDELQEVLTYAEPMCETVDGEKRYQWRAVLNETYRAISENRTISEITVEGLLPIKVSAFDTPGFRRLLAQLQSADIRLCDPADYGPGSMIFGLEGCRCFMSTMCWKLFYHMGGLQTLHLNAAWGTPFGGVLSRTIKALPRNPNMLRALTSLKLTNSLITRHLINFILAHRAVLSHIVLEDYAADYSQYGHLGGPVYVETWEFLFAEICFSRPQALQQFEVNYTGRYKHLLELYLPFERTEIEFMSDSDADEDEVEEAARKQARELSKDPTKKVFAYAVLDDQDMGLIIFRHVNRIRAHHGGDAAEYQCLQEFVQSNARRINRERCNI